MPPEGMFQTAWLGLRYFKHMDKPCRLVYRSMRICIPSVVSGAAVPPVGGCRQTFLY